MGTSSSSRGSPSASPLVPPWADADGSAATVQAALPIPLPAPAEQRFKTFRTEFGRFAGGGDGTILRKAIGHFARTATGGSAVGPRRHGPAYTAGAGLWGVFNDLRSGALSDQQGFDGRDLIGRDMNFCAQEIARALSPENADADRIMVAIQEAISVTFIEMETLDPSAITEDDITTLLVEFLTRCVFQHITEEAGNAWNKAPSAARTIEAETALFSLVKVAVDKHLGPKLAVKGNKLSRSDIPAIERAALVDIWREWEQYQ